MKTVGRAGAAVVVALGLLALLPVTAQDDAGSMVVVTRPGVVFHKAGSSDIRGRGLEKSVNQAIQGGYMPCPSCFGKQVSTSAGPGLAFASGTGRGSIGLDFIPAPPVVTVVQPFGVRAFGRAAGYGGGREVFRNPYQQQDTIKFPRYEQGAFENRH